MRLIVRIPTAIMDMIWFCLTYLNRHARDRHSLELLYYYYYYLGLNMYQHLLIIN